MITIIYFYHHLDLLTFHISIPATTYHHSMVTVSIINSTLFVATRVIWRSNANDKINDKDLVDINDIDQVAINKKNPFISFDLILIFLIGIMITIFKVMKSKWITKDKNKNINVDDPSDLDSSDSHNIEIIDINNNNHNSSDETTALL